MNNRTIIFILGPTSSGKTAVAEEFAKKIGGSIISCDSMQIYRDMDIITRASSFEMDSDVPHCLTRFMSPEEEYNAAKFANDAKKAIEDIAGVGRVPVVEGGTGLYVKALVDGIFPTPPANKIFRKKLEQEAHERGPEFLHARLGGVDPDTAKKLHINDVRRVIRALEIFEFTGRTPHEKSGETSGIGGSYDLRMFGMSLDRALLYGRINRTVDVMFDEGLLEEVRALLGRKLSETAQKALGIKEISAFLEGKISLDKAREELKKNTRRYAKRQLTWFRADHRIEWVDADRAPQKIAEEIAERMAQGAWVEAEEN